MGTGLCTDTKHGALGSPLRLESCIRGRGEAAWNNMQVGAAPRTGHQVPCADISLQCSRGQGWQGEAQAMMSDGSAQGTCYKSLLDTLERGILHISLDCWLQVTDTRPKWLSTEFLAHVTEV